MVNITRSGDSVLVTSFDNSQFPWSDGELSVPLNSMYFILEDETDFIVFKSVYDDSIMFTALIDEIHVNDVKVTRDTIIELVDNVINSNGGGGSASAGVNSINGFQGDVNIKSINGESIIGSGDITIDGGSSGGGITEETDPIFEAWKNGTSIALGGAATASGNRANAIGTESQATSLWANAFGYQAKASQTYSLALGTQAKATAINAIAIGYNTSGATSGAVVIGNAIGVGTVGETSYKTNINNVLKGDTSNYAYVLNEYGNYVRIPTEWTGTQSEYDALGTYYDNITYNIIEG